MEVECADCELSSTPIRKALKDQKALLALNRSQACCDTVRWTCEVEESEHTRIDP